MNTFEFDPGATLPMVESHVMEHGLLFLAGEDEGACDVYAYDPTTGSTANITRR